MAGREAGDNALKIVAGILQKQFRESDLVCRYGGEEFGIILPETDAESARVICERIREAIEKSTVSTSAGDIQYTVSMGIAQLTETPENYMQWMQKADEALYKAKESGRNKVVVS